jgi:glutamate racemase
MKIGVFDSGLGGLAVLREVLKVIPEYDYVYLGDNARAPYGEKSHSLIYKLTKQAIEFLFKKNCSLVILACNSASAQALRKIQREYLPKRYPDRKVLGVIRPTVEALNGNLRRVGVIGTYATVQSRSFVKEIRKVSPKASVYQKACPLLVPIIEEGKLQSVYLEPILKTYLSPLRKRGIQALILGCTHYELILKRIMSHLPGVKIITEGKIVSQKLKTYLKKHPEIEKKLTKNKSREYYITDLNDHYRTLVDLFLNNGRRLNNLRLTSISGRRS